LKSQTENLQKYFRTHYETNESELCFSGAVRFIKEMNPGKE